MHRIGSPCQLAIRACLVDLRRNGIDVQRTPYEDVCRLVRDHLDYFHLMIGAETSAGQIIRLLQEEASEAWQASLACSN